MISILSSGRYEVYGMLIGKFACLPSGGGGGGGGGGWGVDDVGRIRNTAENITSVVAKVFGEYLPHCYGFELGLPWCRGCMYFSSYGTANLH